MANEPKSINDVLDRAALAGAIERAATGKPFKLTRSVPKIWGNRRGIETIMTREEAHELIERARGKTPADWLSWMHAGQALHICGSPTEGLRCAKVAMEMNPCSETMLNVAVILECMGEFGDALDLATRAIMRDPNDQFAGLLWAQGHLRLGHWEEAWQAFEHYCWGRIWEVGFEKYIPQWQGEPLEGKRILVLQGGGFGDNIMFMRWFRDLKEMGAEITYACPDVMVPLLDFHPWIDRLMPTHEGPNPDKEDDLPEVIAEGIDKLGYIDVSEVSDEIKEKVRDAYNRGGDILAICETFGVKFISQFDYFTPIMGIPRRLNASVASVEAHPEPYITAKHPWLKSPRRQPTVGICWMGAERLDPRRHRSLNKTQCEALLQAGRSAGVTWVNLQYGMQPPIEMSQPPIHNWSDTADIVAGLDLVITVDTGVMHLAGAMGKPTWAMIPGLSDWKFLLDRNNMAFYPSVRVFRNKGEGIDNALADVIYELNLINTPASLLKPT